MGISAEIGDIITHYLITPYSGYSDWSNVITIASEQRNTKQVIPNIGMVDSVSRNFARDRIHQASGVTV